MCFGNDALPAPEAPDYAKAAKEGIQVSISSLPALRKIESAYTLGVPVSLTAAEMESIGLDPSKYGATRSQTGGGQVQIGSNHHGAILGQSPATYGQWSDGTYQISDFTGVGDLDLARVQRTKEQEAMREMAPFMLELQKQYGPAYIEEAINQTRLTDPYSFDLRKQLGADLMSGKLSSEKVGLTDTPSLQDFMESEQTGRMRSQLEQQLLDELAMGNQLTTNQQRNLQQGVRGAQTARGNYMGRAPEFEEALQYVGYGDQLANQRRGNALGFLQSGQSTSDSNNRFTQANNANRQQQFANLMDVYQQRNTANVQDITNAQGYVFAQPISSQFANLSSASQGATPYVNTGANVKGLQYDPSVVNNATGFATNVFGTQANIYGTQMANQGPSLGSTLFSGAMTLGGAALGASK